MIKTYAMIMQEIVLCGLSRAGFFKKTTFYGGTAFDESSLFAGKIHAVICRAWRSRIKGRDLYDYVFYLARRTPVNLKHLRERLLQSGYIIDENACTLEDVKKMLVEKFESIDYEQAKSDVEPFIRDSGMLVLWSVDFFRQITDELRDM